HGGSMRIRSLALAGSALVALACGEARREAPGAEAEAADEYGSTAPSALTAAANAKFGAALALDDPADFEEAKRGLVARDPKMEVTTASGRRWSQDLFAFVAGEAPASVNPSLWRQAKLNGNHGLYRVAEGIYQVRGYDVSNMSWIRGRT